MRDRATVQNTQEAVARRINIACDLNLQAREVRMARFALYLSDDQ